MPSPCACWCWCWCSWSIVASVYMIVQSSIVMRCVNLTDAEAAEETVLWGGILCCAALQAAAALLALLLPSRRRRLRRGIEFVALAAAFLDHYMYYAVVCLILTADPEYLFYRISRTAFIGFLASGDILGSIALILEACVGGEEQQLPSVLASLQAIAPCVHDSMSWIGS